MFQLRHPACYSVKKVLSIIMCRRLATHSNNSLRQHSKLCNFLPRASIRTLISKWSWQKQSISSIRVWRGLFPYAARSQSKLVQALLVFSIKTLLLWKVLQLSSTLKYIYWKTLQDDRQEIPMDKFMYIPRWEPLLLYWKKKKDNITSSGVAFLC